MQIIQKIREKGAAIVIGVIALSLIGFILMDANLGMSRNAGGDRTTIGKVNGAKISADELDAKVKAFEDQAGGRSSGSQGAQFRENAWNQLVFEKVAESEFEKLGINFSAKELTAIMFSDDAPYTLKQAFTNKETNQYDIAKVQEWWSNAKKFKGEQRDAIESQVVEPIRLQGMYAKYAGLVSASGYYPSWMKNKEANEAKEFANISYVAVPYSTIADSTVKVSDEDIIAYMSKRKARYEEEGGRLISYVTFSTNPSASDSAETFKTVNQFKDAFAADTTPQAFVSKNASSIEYNDTWVTKAQIGSIQKDTLAALPQNAVYGPYLDGAYYVLAKKVKTRMLGDSVKCRHILLGTADRETGAPIMADSVAKAKADSIEMAIKSGASFDELEAKYSTDKAAHKDRGVMTFDIATIQNRQGFSPEFADFLLNEKGETRKVVKTNFGWHYIEIMEVKNPAPAYKIAYMAKEIIPSDETVAMSNNAATKLSTEAKDVKSFDDYISKNKLQKTDVSKVLAENDYAIENGPQDARQVVRWAFEAKEGQVSEPFNMKNEFLVAVLTKVVPKGLPLASIIRPKLEQTVRDNKKAAVIKQKLTATPTLESAAAAYPGISIAVAGADSSLVFTSNVINGIGKEHKVIGAAFNKTLQNKASAPIEGTNGVYVIKVNSYGTKTVDTPPVDKARMMAQQLGYGSFEALKKMADIKDNRSKFY